MALPDLLLGSWFQQQQEKQQQQRQQQPIGVLIALAAVVLTTLLLLLLAQQRRRQQQQQRSDTTKGKGLPKSVANAAYLSLRARELAWLRGLPPQAQAALLASAASTTTTAAAGDRGGRFKQQRSSPLSSPSGFPAHELVHSGEVGLVLVGVKPCAVVEDRWGGMMPLLDDASFAEAHAEGVLRPWMEEFHLAEYGFVLTRVASPCTPPETRGHPGFQGAALFYWKMHPEAGFVESIFLGRHAAMPSRLLGEALGYPGREGRLAVPISYLSLDALPYAPPALDVLKEEEEEEEEEDEDDDKANNGGGAAAGAAAAPPTAASASAAVPTLRVPLLQYVGREEDGQRIGEHFQKAGRVFMAVFGQPLGLDLGEACAGWDTGALAKLLVAAFPSAFDDEEVRGGDELGGLLRCLESGALVPRDWMRRRFPELPPVVRMLRLVDKLQREKEAAGR